MSQSKQYTENEFFNFTAKESLYSIIYNLLAGVAHIQLCTLCRKHSKIQTQHFYSVPARLGKGQGAKEIGNNLARKRPKFWHNLVRKRHKMCEFPKFDLVGD